MSTHTFWYESLQIPTSGFQPVVLSTRVRMARNISGLPFPNRMSLEEYVSLRTSVFRVLEKYRYLECKIAKGAQVRADDFLVTLDAGDKGISTFGRPETGQVIVIGDEDHFRISTVTAGLSLDTAMDLTSNMETLLAKDFPFAFDKQRFGFLTASMANAGLAMRVSVWMHVPGLILSETWAELEPLLKSMDISVRGILGEESELTAGMVQLSNRTSYGKSSDEILAKLKRVIDLVNESERSAISGLLRQYKSKTIDYLKWMSLLEQPFISRDAFIHAVSAALLAARLGYNVRFDNQLALKVLIAGFKSRHEDGLIQMQVVRNLLKDTLMDT